MMKRVLVFGAAAVAEGVVMMRTNVAVLGEGDDKNKKKGGCCGSGKEETAPAADPANKGNGADPATDTSANAGDKPAADGTEKPAADGTEKPADGTPRLEGPPPVDNSQAADGTPQLEPPPAGDQTP